MIAYLSGTIKFKEANILIVEINSIGYQVLVPWFVWQNSQVNKKIELFIYTFIRQDEISLFGFLSQADQKIFVSLISVAGIGPRLALNIISYAQGSHRIIKAIQEADVDFFASVRGLGKKSAQRVIVDLKPKIGGLKELEFETEKDQELIEALKSLGFSRDEIGRSIKGIDKDLPLEQKIRQALKKQS